MGGISIWQLLIVAVIVILLFGTKKLRNIGGDLGSAVKGFKKAIAEDEPSKNNDADFKQEADLTSSKQPTDHQKLAPNGAVDNSNVNTAQKQESKDNQQV